MIIICKNCGKENKSTNIKCEFCNSELVGLDDTSNSKKKETTLEQKFCYLCFMVVSILMIACGLFFIGSNVYSIILENKTKKEYIQTNATLVDKDCKYNEDKVRICKATYEYEVKGDIYTVVLDLEVVEEVYKNSEVVYYNPNNPSESVIFSDIDDMNGIIIIIFGIVLIGVAIFIMLFTTAIYKMIKEPKKIM